jgi:hypothetical protein
MRGRRAANAYITLRQSGITKFADSAQIASLMHEDLRPLIARDRFVSIRYITLNK